MMKSNRWMLRQVPIVIILATLASKTVAGDVCFRRTGSEDPRVFPCSPDADVSQCCQAGDYCYSNGLCAPGPSAPLGITPFFIDGCTKSTWDSPMCLNKSCINIEGNGIQDCPSRGVGYYCCYGLTGCDCSDESAVFKLPSGTIIGSIDLAITKTTAKPTSSKTSTPTTTTTSPTSTNTSSASTAGTSTSTSSTATPSADSSSNPTSKEKKTGIKPLTLGLAIGIPAVLLVVFTFIACMMWRQRKAAKIAGDQRLEMAGLTGNGYSSVPQQEHYKPSPSPEPVQMGSYYKPQGQSSNVLEMDGRPQGRFTAELGG